MGGVAGSSSSSPGQARRVRGRPPGRVLSGTIRPAGGPSPCQRLALRETRPDTVKPAKGWFYVP